MRLGERQRLLDRGARQRVERDRLVRQRRLALHARKPQQLVDELGVARESALQRFEARARVGRQVGVREVVRLDARRGDRRAQLVSGVGHQAALLFQQAAHARQQAVDGVHERQHLGRNAVGAQRLQVAHVAFVHVAGQRHQRHEALPQQQVDDQQQQRHQHEHRHQRRDRVVARDLVAQALPLRHAERAAVDIVADEDAPMHLEGLDVVQARRQGRRQHHVDARIGIDAGAAQRADHEVRLGVLLVARMEALARRADRLRRERGGDLLQLGVLQRVRVAVVHPERDGRRRRAHDDDGRGQPQRQPLPQRAAHEAPPVAAACSTRQPRPRTLRIRSAPSLRRRPWMITSTALLSTSSPQP